MFPETSQLIYSSNQLTGFYMMETLFVKRLKKSLNEIKPTIKRYSNYNRKKDNFTSLDENNTDFKILSIMFFSYRLTPEKQHVTLF